MANGSGCEVFFENVANFVNFARNNLNAVTFSKDFDGIILRQDFLWGEDVAEGNSLPLHLVGLSPVRGKEWLCHILALQRNQENRSFSYRFDSQIH